MCASSTCIIVYRVIDNSRLNISFLGTDTGSLSMNLQDELHGREYNAPAHGDALETGR